MHISLKRIVSNAFTDAIVYNKKDFKTCGENVIILPRCHFSAPELIELEGEIFIGNNCTFFGDGSITIRRGVVISPGVTIYSSIHNYDSGDLQAFPFDDRFIMKKVIIGEYSWISTNSIIMPGVTIGRFCVVGAGSVVTKNVEDHSFVAGVPAKEIRKRNNVNPNGLEDSWVGKFRSSRDHIIK